MTMFSRKTSLKLSGIVAGGHPPIIHSIVLADGVTGLVAGNPVLVGETGVTVWDGVPETAVGKMGICLNDPQEGDRSVLVLLHGCYRAEVITIGGTGMTEEQRLPLMVSGLYPEDSWGG